MGELWVLGARPGDESVLVRDHPQMPAHGVQQLARREQECRIGRLADRFVSLREGFVDQHAARRHRIDQMGPERPMQVMGDDHRGKRRAGRQRPRRAFEIGFAHVHAGNRAQRRERGSIAIERDDGVPARREPARVAAAARGDVEHRAARRRQMRPARDPA